jgi:hypothetical protein
VTIEIKHRHTGAVVYTSQVETVREALEEAVKARANLDGAYLDGAYLAGANLDGAYLDGAYLAGANLARANLARAYLDGANLAGANLAGANLARANLARAYLDGANLDGAYLAGAIGVGDWAKAIRDDIRTVLDTSPHEVPGLLQLLWDGRVDGTVYEGECACLVGSVAKVRGCRYDAIPGLRPDSSRPAERWFLRIRKGDTPVTNPSAAFAAAVIAQWQHERATAKPVGKRPPQATEKKGEGR